MFMTQIVGQVEITINQYSPRMSACTLYNKMARMLFILNFGNVSCCKYQFFLIRIRKTMHLKKKNIRDARISFGLDFLDFLQIKTLEIS